MISLFEVLINFGKIEKFEIEKFEIKR